MSATTTTPQTPWPTVKLGDVCEVVSVRGHQIKQNEIKPTGRYPVVSQSERKIEGYSDEPIAIKDVPLILFGDHTCCVKFIDFPFIVGADGTKLLRSNMMELNYFQYCLENARESLCDGKYRRHFSDLIEMEIPLPPLDIQREIVAKVEAGLKEADALVAHFKRLAALADETFKAELDETFSTLNAPTVKLGEQGSAEDLYQQIQAKKAELIKAGKLKKEKPLPSISSKDIPFEIPSTWKWVRLGDVCSKIVDGDHNPPKGVSYETDYWMLSAQNISNDRLVALDKVRYLSKEVFEQVNKRTMLNKGDVLFTIVGALGRSCVYEGGHNICFQRSVAVLTTLIFNHYLKYVLDSGFIQELLLLNSTGAAQKGFYLNQVELIPIPLPPLDIQREIVGKLEAVKARCERLKAEAERGLKAAEALRKAVLAEAFEQ